MLIGSNYQCIIFHEYESRNYHGYETNLDFRISNMEVSDLIDESIIWYIQSINFWKINIRMGKP